MTEEIFAKFKVINDDNFGEKCPRPVCKRHFNRFIIGGSTFLRRFQKTFLVSFPSIAYVVVVVGKDCNYNGGSGECWRKIAFL